MPAKFDNRDDLLAAADYQEIEEARVQLERNKKSAVTVVSDTVPGSGDRLKKNNVMKISGGQRLSATSAKVASTDLHLQEDQDETVSVGINVA